MLNKYFFSALKSFSDDDWKNFKIYIKSQDAVSGRKYFPLVNHLSKYSGDMETLRKIPAEKLFENAFKKKYGRQTLLNRQTELLNHTREYLTFISFKNNIAGRKNFYYSELLGRRLLDLYSRDMLSTDELIGKNIFDSDSYRFMQENVLLNASFQQQKKKQKPAMGEYSRHSRILLADILCSLYRTGQELLIHKYENIEHSENPVLDFINTIHPDLFFKELLKKKDRQYLIPAIRYYLFKCIQNPADKKYASKAVKLFYSNEKYFTEDFRTDIYRTLMTYYIMNLNRGEKEYNNELFRLYKRKLSQNLVSDLKMSGYPANVFREYIVIGLKVRQYKWVEMVIRKYAPLLPEHLRDDEVNLAMIRLCFNRREFGKALSLINRHKTKNNLHHLDSMRYRLACFFEMKKYEEAYFEIDKSKHYLKYNRSRLPEIHRVLLKNFLDKVLKMLNYLANPYNKDPEMILYDFENEESNYMMKDWVIQKAREILTSGNRI